MPTAQRHPRIRRPTERFGLREEHPSGDSPPCLNLNADAVRGHGLDHGLDHDEVARAGAKQLESITRMHRAMGTAKLAKGRLAETPQHRKVLNNDSRRRSDDIYVAFDPHWMIADFDGLMVASTSGSPWTHDTFDPVVFAGAGPAPHISRHAPVVDSHRDNGSCQAGAPLGRTREAPPSRIPLARSIHEIPAPVRADGVLARKTSEQMRRRGGGPVEQSASEPAKRAAAAGRRPTQRRRDLCVLGS